MSADDRGRYHRMSGAGKSEAVTIGELGGKLDMVVDSVATMNASVQGLTSAHASLASSVKSSWHDINELKKDVKRVPGKMKELLDDHEEDCVPRQRARKRALMDDSDTGIRRPGMDDSQQFDVPVRTAPDRTAIPLRWLIIGGIVIVCSVLIAGIVIGATVKGAPEKAGKAIQSLTESAPKK